MPHWTEQYLGLPYEPAGCWLLFERVQRERFGRAVSIGALPEDRRERIQAFRSGAGTLRWVETRAPIEGDAVLMTSSRHPHHVGVYVAIGRGRVLHSIEGQGSQCTPIDNIAAIRWRILGYYRPEAECAP
ncbi:MAG TPA: hypothetical protein VFB13_03355 [Reyranella sp.]|jgi:hypothetical protein|nr:hypothetical protein [Reyranella sp.]